MATPSNAQINEYLKANPGTSGRQAISAINSGWKPSAPVQTVMGGVSVGKTPVAQVAPQASTPKENVPPPVQQTTPVAQVTPQASASTTFALQGGNPSFFPNLDPKTGLPIINQAKIDAELARTKSNVLILRYVLVLSQNSLKNLVLLIVLQTT